MEEEEEKVQMIEEEIEDIIQMDTLRREALKQMIFATIVGKLDTGNFNSILFYTFLYYPKYFKC